eukprot:5857898-Pyramimonas_sp.AAC.1
MVIGTSTVGGHVAKVVDQCRKLSGWKVTNSGAVSCSILQPSGNFYFQRLLNFQLSAFSFHRLCTFGAVGEIEGKKIG